MSLFLKFDTLDGAENRSKELWVALLERPVSPDAFTTSLYSFQPASEESGGSYLIIDDDGDLLSEEEKLRADSQETYDAWCIANTPRDD